MRLLRAVPALALVLAAAPAAAQGAVECPVDVYTPTQLAQAGVFVGRAVQAGESPEAQKSLRDAMKFHQDDKKLAANPVGAAYQRAQIYILWMHQEGIGETMTVEQLNLKGAKGQTINILEAAAAALKDVDALSPACAAETAQWRGSKPFIDRINKAYTFLGADAVDSAAYYAERSALLNPTSTFVLNAQAQVAFKRGDVPKMLGHLREAIAEAAKDTSLADTKKQMQFQLAQTAKDYAMTGGAADKAALTKESLAMFTELLREHAATTEGSYAFSASAEMIAASQDSAAAKELLAPMVADASPYHDLTLQLAADVARMFGRNDDAMAMYRGALAKNPNIRDANYFLAYMYYEAKQPDKMMPLTDKLMEIDPSNGDNFLMRAYAYSLMAGAEKDAKKKAELLKIQDEFAGKEAALATQHKLTVSRFERKAEGGVLAGQIENFTKAAKSYSLTMHFLDASGAVLESVTTEVAGVKAGDRGTFEIKATKPGIVAYKYDALK
ncbi:MAG: tetratricopeptide repeat protein [Gemmatimonadaceae bacterium]|nr:tetratricopeptide repeat protein [Gemmatimonadaceae bacterium]